MESAFCPVSANQTQDALCSEGPRRARAVRKLDAQCLKRLNTSLDNLVLVQDALVARERSGQGCCETSGEGRWPRDHEGQVARPSRSGDVEGGQKADEH